MFNKGDRVRTERADGTLSRATYLITRANKRTVRTECGRTWDRLTGEWVSEMVGNKPLTWPYPIIVREDLSKLNTTGEVSDGN